MFFCRRESSQSGSNLSPRRPAGVVSRALRENNPLVQQLNVQPSQFQQHQFTTRLDAGLSAGDNLTGTFFFSNFPGLDSFPDPSSLTSPFTLRRADRNRTLAISEQHIFGPRLINEARFGYFYLNNTRSLDDPFLAEEYTSAAAGISNPALHFDDSPGTRRLGHFIGGPARTCRSSPSAARTTSSTAASSRPTASRTT